MTRGLCCLVLLLSACTDMPDLFGDGENGFRKPGNGQVPTTQPGQETKRLSTAAKVGAAILGTAAVGVGATLAGREVCKDWLEKKSDLSAAETQALFKQLDPICRALAGFPKDAHVFRFTPQGKAMSLGQELKFTSKKVARKTKELDQGQHAIVMVDKKLYNSQDKSKPLADGTYSYILDLIKIGTGEDASIFYAAPGAGQIANLSHGLAVAAAGTMVVENGQIVHLTNDSPEYKPGLVHLRQVILHLQAGQVFQDATVDVVGKGRYDISDLLKDNNLEGNTEAELQTKSLKWKDLDDIEHYKLTADRLTADRSGIYLFAVVHGKGLNDTGAEIDKDRFYLVLRVHNIPQDGGRYVLKDVPVDHPIFAPGKTIALAGEVTVDKDAKVTSVRMESTLYTPKTKGGYKPKLTDLVLFLEALEKEKLLDDQATVEAQGKKERIKVVFVAIRNKKTEAHTPADRPLLGADLQEMWNTLKNK